MSWISITMMFVFACLLGALGLSEWIVRRQVGARDDRDSLT